jgi:3D (Asp-Asp-Asp) domain-containing protein
MFLEVSWSMDGILTPTGHDRPRAGSFAGINGVPGPDYTDRSCWLARAVRRPVPVIKDVAEFAYTTHMTYLALLLSLAIGGSSVYGQAEGAADKTSAITVSVTASCIRGKTQSGTPNDESSVAADVRVFPLGSRLQVDFANDAYDGTYTVRDTGRAIKGHELDIFIADCAAARRFGRQKARVRVLQQAPMPKS